LIDNGNPDHRRYVDELLIPCASPLR